MEQNKETLELAQSHLDKVRGDKWYEYIDEAFDFVMEYKDEFGGDFGINRLYEEELDEIAQRELNNYGWERLKHLFFEASGNPPYGWRLDGYGNVCDITKDDIEIALCDIKSELQRITGVEQD